MRGSCVGQLLKSGQLGVTLPDFDDAIYQPTLASRYVDTVADACRRSRCEPAPHEGLSIALRYKPTCRKTVVYWL